MGMNMNMNMNMDVNLDMDTTELPLGFFGFHLAARIQFNSVQLS